MGVPYTYLEVEAIENDYDQQVTLKAIAEQINRDFHKGQPVRTAKSVSYVIGRINSNDGWYDDLGRKWLDEIGD